MWYYPFSAVVNALASTIFGLMAYLKNPKDPKNKSYAFYCFSLSLWSYSYVCWQLSSTPSSALFFCRALMMGAILIPITHVHQLLNLFEWKAPRILKAGYLWTAFLLLCNFTPWLVAGVRPDPLFRSWPIPGPLFHPYLAGFFICLSYSLRVIYRARKNATGRKKKLLTMVFAATVIGYGGGATNFPLWYGVPWPPIGNILVTVYALSVFYILAKYRLLDVKIIIRKALLYSFVSASLASVYVGTMTLLARLIEIGFPTSFAPTSSFVVRSFTPHGFKNIIQNSFSLSCLSATALSLGFGIFVLTQGRQKSLNQLWCGLCFCIGTWSLGLGMTVRSVSFESAYFWTRWFTHTGAISIPIVYFHFVVTLLKRRPIRTLLAGYILAMGFCWLDIMGRLVSVRPIAPFRFYAMTISHYWLFLAYFFGLVISGHWLLFRAIQAAQGNSKKQLIAVFAGTSVGFIGGSETFLMAFGLPIFPYGLYVVPVYIVSVSYAIFKHQLMDINIVIRRTLLYSALSAILACVYVSTITLLAYVWGARKGSISPFSSAIAAALITLLFNPLRNRMQAFVDQKFARSRLVDSDQLVRLSADVAGHENLEKIADSVGRILEETVHPKVWALYLRTENDKEFLKIASTYADALPERLPLVNAWSNYFLASLLSPETGPLPNGWPAAVPLMGGHDLLGFLLAGEKRSEEAYTEEDVVLLRLVANQAAVAFERSKMAQRISSAFVHEVKTPLANIALPAELTFMDLEDLGAGKKSIGDIMPKIKKRMKYIMEQALLAGNRVDAVREATGAEDIAQGKADLKQVLESSLRQMEELLQGHRIQLRADLSGSPASIPGSAQQLEIVFANLIKNSAEAMAASVAARDLHVSVRQENGKAWIRIQDSGPGIDSTAHPYLFMPNYSTKGPEGSGMGLFLSRQIIEAHGGSIQVSSAIGAGTIFTVILPA